MRKRRTRILIRFAITIVIILIVGGISRVLSDQLLSEEQRQGVLVEAVPFLSVFVSIVLAFACLIVIVAVEGDGKVPLRTYRPVEWITTGGIFVGIIGLFQGWKLFAYQYGFLVLLISVLAFMVWSHLTPMSPRLSKRLPPLSRKAHRTGLFAAVIVWLILGVVTSMAAKPTEPYGHSSQIWELMMTDQEKAEAADEAEADYLTGRIPYLFIISLMPAAIVYFITRELAVSETQEETNQTAAKVGGLSQPQIGQ